MADNDRFTLAFGSFQLSRSRKLLTEDSIRVPLGSRAFDLLSVMAGRPGEVIPKEELTALVWPDTLVEESSLRVHIAALRKALGDGREGARFVINVPGRGYSFVAPVGRIDKDERPEQLRDVASDDERAVLAPSTARFARMIGRESDAARVKQSLLERRFLTIVGPGGIGKTAMASEIASRLVAHFEDGIVFVDLGGVEQASDAPAVISARLGVSGRAVDSVPVLGTLLRRKRMLLVLDNCEHVSQVVGPLIQRQLAVSPHLVVLATSREPLGVISETLYRLGGLESPPARQPLTQAQAMQFESVALFAQRAQASSGSFTLSDEEAALVGDICRWLGGNPLAIELVAARTDLFGVADLAAMLDSRLLQSPQARRTALPRHRTIAAMLDWSYRLLSATERSVLHRLSVFRTGFSLEAARQVVTDHAAPSKDVVGTLLKLASKSLVLSDVRTGSARYELAGLTRAYVHDKFVDSSDYAGTCERHARYMLGVLDQSKSGWPTADKAEWMASYGVLMDDVLSAIEFSLEEPGHRDLGIDLLAAGMSLAVRFARFTEFEALTKRALSALDVSAPDRGRELRLRAILIYLLESQHGASERLAEEVAKAKQLGIDQEGTWIKIDTQILSFIRVWAAGNYSEMAEYGRRFDVIAKESDDPLASLIAARVQAQAHHFNGHHDQSRSLCELVLNNRVRRGPLTSMTGTTDFSISMRIVLARIHWMQGRAELAAAVADEALVHAKSDEPQSLCLTLAFAACPIALWSGDVRKARELIDLLREQASDHSLKGLWLPWSQALSELLDHRDDGRLGSASSQFVQSAARHGLLLVDHLLTIEPELAHDDAAAPERGQMPSWCAPELQRVAGERLLRIGAQLEAETSFKSAINLARQQNAVAWELRAATSLARLWQRQSRASDGYRLLSGVYERMPQGRGTTDHASARTLLLALGGSLQEVR